MLQNINFIIFFVLLLVGCPEPTTIENQPAENPPTQEEEVPQGDEGQPCYDNGACRPGLLCDNGICVVPGIYDSGNDDGTADGTADGAADGTADGTNDGSADGFADGFADFFGTDADAGPAEVVGWGEVCGTFLAPGPTCEEGLVCGLLTGICEELCDTPGVCTNCCPVSGTGYCEEGLLFSFCQWENGAPPPEPVPMDAGVIEHIDAGMHSVGDAGVLTLDDAGAAHPFDAGHTVVTDAGATIFEDAGMSLMVDAGEMSHVSSDSGVSSIIDAGASSATDAGL